MKISKKVILALGGLFMVTSLGLVTVFAKDLFVDLNNAVQHIKAVKIINTSSNYPAILKNINNLVRIETNNNFILSGKKNSNEVSKRHTYSSILGGGGNTITGYYSVIVAGSGNSVSGDYGVIPGGESNEIEKSNYATILGGKGNSISNTGAYSVIVGGTNNTVGNTGSVALGSGNTVEGKNSVVLGQNSNVNASGTFLWTDGNDANTLEANNVFAVSSDSGVVINASEAHSFAKLTLGGSMFLYSDPDDKNIACGNGAGGGIMRMVYTGGQMCLCSCDGSGWNSMFGKGKCMGLCNISMQPRCGSGSVKRSCTGDMYYYEGDCIEGNLVGGTGAYFLTMDEKLYWSCQTEDGVVANCELDHSEISTGCFLSPTWWEGKCSNTEYECASGTVTQTSELNSGSTVYGYKWMCEGYGGGTTNKCCVKCETGYQDNGRCGCNRVCEPLSTDLQGKVLFVNHSDRNIEVLVDNKIKLATGESAALSMVRDGKKCVVLCNESSGYVYSGGTCVPGAHCAQWDEDKILGYNKGPDVTSDTNNTNWQYKATGDLLGCQFRCDTASNYAYSGGECVNVGCIGVIYNATLVAGSDKGITGDVYSRPYASGGAASGHKCAYLCNSGYTYVENNGIPQCAKCKVNTVVEYDDGRVVCQIDSVCPGEGMVAMKRCMKDRDLSCDDGTPGSEIICWHEDYCYYWGEVSLNIPKKVGKQETGVRLESSPLGEGSKKWVCVTGDIVPNQCQFHCLDGATCKDGECWGKISNCPSYSSWPRATTTGGVSVDEFLKLEEVPVFVNHGGGITSDAIWEYVENSEDAKEPGCYFNCGDDPLNYFGTYYSYGRGYIKGCQRRSCKDLYSYLVYTKEYVNNAYIMRGFGGVHNDSYQYTGSLNGVDDYAGCYYTCADGYESVKNLTGYDQKMMCVQFKNMGGNGRCPDWDYANERGKYTGLKTGKYLSFDDPAVSTKVVNGGGTTRIHVEDLETVQRTGCYFNCSGVDVSFKGSEEGCVRRSCKMPNWINSCSGYYDYAGYGSKWEDNNDNNWYSTKYLSNVDLKQERCYYGCKTGYVLYKIPFGRVNPTAMQGRNVCISEEYFHKEDEIIEMETLYKIDGTPYENPKIDRDKGYTLKDVLGSGYGCFDLEVVGADLPSDSCQKPEWMKSSCVNHYEYKIGVGKSDRDWAYTGERVFSNFTNDDFNAGKCYYTCATGYRHTALTDEEKQRYPELSGNQNLIWICVESGQLNDGGMRYSNRPIEQIYACHFDAGLHFEINAGMNVEKLGDVQRWLITVTPNGGNLVNPVIKNILPKTLAYSGYTINDRGGLTLKNFNNSALEWQLSGSLLSGKKIEITVETKLKDFPEVWEDDYTDDYTSKVTVMVGSQTKATKAAKFDILSPFAVSLDISGSKYAYNDGDRIKWIVTLTGKRDVLSGFVIKYQTPDSMEYVRARVLNTGGVTRVNNLTGTEWKVEGKLISGNAVKIAVTTELKQNKCTKSKESKVSLAKYGKTYDGAKKSFETLLPLDLNLEISGNDTVVSVHDTLQWNLSAKATNDISGFDIKYSIPTNNMEFDGHPVIIDSGGVSIDISQDGLIKVKGMLKKNEEIRVSLKTIVTKFKHNAADYSVELSVNRCNVGESVSSTGRGFVPENNNGRDGFTANDAECKKLGEVTCSDSSTGDFSWSESVGACVPACTSEVCPYGTIKYGGKCNFCPNPEGAVNKDRWSKRLHSCVNSASAVCTGDNEYQCINLEECTWFDESGRCEDNG